MSLPRPSMLPALVAFVVPVAADSVWMVEAEAAAAMIIVDPIRQIAPSIEILRDVLGLTPGEAKVARELFDDCNLTETASRVGISYETARTHMARVLAKAGVERQAALIKLMASMVPPLDAG